ncbi:MAG: hypothetical protein J6W37_09870 [Bacteroidales bacterium]|nr:hypothetical protein [Bacteroidales bacterium]
MKTKILLMLCTSLCLAIGAFAQDEKASGFQIEVDAIHSRSDVKHYYSNWGGEMFLNRIVNKHRIGIGLGGVYNGGKFSCYRIDESDGSKIYQSTNCWNKWFSLKLNYAYSVYASEHSAININPFVSLNYLIINESGLRNSVWYEYKKNYNNKFGFGFALEYEVKFNAFSTSIKLAPECVMVAPFRFGMGVDAISILGTMRRSITLKYML